MVKNCRFSLKVVWLSPKIEWHCADCVFCPVIRQQKTFRMNFNNLFSFLLEKFLIISWYRYMMLPYKNLSKASLWLFLLKSDVGVKKKGEKIDIF